MVDYQFLGMVAAMLAVLTRGSLLPMLVVTAFVAVVLVLCEAGGRWLRRRRSQPATEEARLEPVIADADLGQWMAAVERVLSARE